MWKPPLLQRGPKSKAHFKQRTNVPNFSHKPRQPPPKKSDQKQSQARRLWLPGTPCDARAAFAQEELPLDQCAQVFCQPRRMRRQKRCGKAMHALETEMLAAASLPAVHGCTWSTHTASQLESQAADDAMQPWKWRWSSKHRASPMRLPSSAALKAP
eukprot:2327574-Amphidinium_carterae.1